MVKDILDFLNTNSGAFNLLFSLIVAVATVVYAKLTASLVKETKQLREAQTEPLLEVFFRSHDECMALLEFVIKNVGQGSAYDVRITFSNNSSFSHEDEWLSSLKKLKVANTGIKLLYPGQEFCSYWTDVRQNSDIKLKTTISVIVTFTSATGVNYEKLHVIDLSELEGVVKLGTPPLSKIARSVEKIQEDFRKLSSGFKKLEVNVHSAEDRENEKREIEHYLKED